MPRRKLPPVSQSTPLERQREDALPPGIGVREWLARPGLSGAIAKSVFAALIGGAVNLCVTRWGGGVGFAAFTRWLPRGALHLALLGLLLVALIVISILAIPARDDSHGNDTDA